MKSLKIGISALLVLNTIGVQAQSLNPTTENSLDKLSGQINHSESVLSTEEMKLRGELLLKETILEGFQTMDSFNEAAGFNSDYGKFVAIPSAVASLYFLSVGTPKALNIVNLLTPAERLKAFTKELNILEKEILAAKKVLRNANINLSEVKYVNNISSEAVSLANSKVKAAKLNYDAAIGKKAMHLQVKPSVFYKTGRFIRGAAKSTLVIGSIVLSVSMISDVLILWLPEDVQAYKNQTSADIQVLRHLLGQEL